MKLLSASTYFPQISIRDLQSSFLKQKNKKNQIENKKSFRRQGIFKITSPFSQHTAKQYKQNITQIIKNQKKQMLQIIEQHQKKAFQKFQQLKKKKNIEQILNKQKRKNIFQTTKPFENNDNSKSISQLLQDNNIDQIYHQKNQIINANDSNNSNSNNQKMDQLKLNKKSSSRIVKQKQIKQTSKIDNDNKKFIEFIKQRMLNKQTKKKYLRSIYNFIKIHKDNHSNVQSATVLQNSLNIVLDHYQFDQIINHTNLDQNDKLKISKFMNINQKKVDSILQDFKKTVSQANSIIINAKRRTSIKYQNQNNQQIRYNQTEFQDIFQSFLSFNDKNQKNHDPIFTSINKISRQNSRQKQNINSSQNTSSQLKLPTLTSKTSFKTKINIKKSIKSSEKKLNYSLESSKNDITNQKSQKNLSIANIQLSKKNLKKQKYGNQIFITQQIKSQILKQQTRKTFKKRKSSRFSMYKDGQKKSILLKKTIMNNNKLRFSQDENYEQYLKLPEQYKNLIKQSNNSNYKNVIQLFKKIQKAQNSSQKIKILYKQLKFDQIVEDMTKVQQIFNNYKPFFTQQDMQIIMNQIVINKDKKYIQKLKKHLDQVLTTIKRNEVKPFDYDSFYFQSSDANKKRQNLVLQKIQLKQKKQKQFFKDYFYEDKLSQFLSNMAQQQQKRKKLTQKSLQNFVQQNLKPLISKKLQIQNQVKCEQKQKVKLFQKQKHKKILIYMKNKYNKYFNQLNQSFNKFSQSLQYQSYN